MLSARDGATRTVDEVCRQSSRDPPRLNSLEADLSSRISLTLYYLHRNMSATLPSPVAELLICASLSVCDQYRVIHVFAS